MEPFVLFLLVRQYLTVGKKFGREAGENEMHIAYGINSIGTMQRYLRQLVGRQRTYGKCEAMLTFLNLSA